MKGLWVIVLQQLLEYQGLRQRDEKEVVVLDLTSSQSSGKDI